MEEDIGVLDRIKGLPWAWILTGVMVGIILRVATVHIARLNVCPAKNCVSEAEVIPVSDRGYFQQVYDILENAKSRFTGSHSS